jgi:hypothetical protein
VVARDPRALDPQRAAALPFDCGAERFDQIEQDVDVPDMRDVGNLARLIGQQARGDERQR